MGTALEDRADFDQALRYFRQGNVLRREVETYDPVEPQAMTDRLIGVFDAGLLAQQKAPPGIGPTPVFIVGLPRSGSTLVEQILASHDDVTGTRELVAMDRIVANLDMRAPFPEVVRSLESSALPELRDRYLESARAYSGDRAFFTDKTPGNFRNIGLIHLLLPEAMIIAVRRHPLDCCMSCYKQLFASGQSFTYDLFELGEYYLEYDRLMLHWHERLPGKILTVHYEELVKDLRQQVGRLLDFCGLPMQEACVEFHRTARPIESASSEQVRQPVYDTAIDHWRNYEPHIAELVDALKPVLPPA